MTVPDEAWLIEADVGGWSANRWYTGPVSVSVKHCVVTVCAPFCWHKKMSHKGRSPEGNKPAMPVQCPLCNIICFCTISLSSHVKTHQKDPLGAQSYSIRDEDKMAALEWSFYSSILRDRQQNLMFIADDYWMKHLISNSTFAAANIWTQCHIVYDWSLKPESLRVQNKLQLLPQLFIAVIREQCEMKTLIKNGTTDSCITTSHIHKCSSTEDSRLCALWAPLQYIYGTVSVW